MSYKFYEGHIYNKKDTWTDQFIEEHKDEIDWAKLLKKVSLTEEQIEKYSNYIISMGMKGDILISHPL